MKRGLAAAAVSAVAVTGIPALAMADTLDSQITDAQSANTVELYNLHPHTDGDPSAVDMTVMNDGTDTTVRLQAGGGEQVPSVLFQVQVNNSGTFSDIATVTERADDGSFYYEWNPADNGAFPGDEIDLRLRNGADPNNAALGDQASNFILRGATATNTNAINITSESEKGYFQDPDNITEYTLGVTGTTTVTQTDALAAPQLSWLDGGGFVVPSIVESSSNSGDGTFEGVLRFSDAVYPFDDPDLPPVEADQMMVRAETNARPFNTQDQTDDFEGYTLYRQVLTSLTATITPRTEPDAGIVTVTVLDQNSKPIAGIDVYDAFGGFVDETNGRGQVTTTQNDTITYYYANADSDDAFSPAAGDKRSNDVNNLAAVVDIATAPSDGNVPVGTTVTETIKVTDTNGDPISNRPVRIKRNGPADNGETVFKTTNDNGELTYTFTCVIEGVATLEVGIQGPTPLPPNDPFTFAIGHDTVNCKNPTPPANINAKLRGKSSGGKDILTVTAPSIAKGAKVVLQKKVNGKWTQVGKTKKLDGAGQRQWGTKDRNKRKVTKYRAIVSGNANVKRDVTPVARVR